MNLSRRPVVLLVLLLTALPALALVDQARKKAQLWRDPPQLSGQGVKLSIDDPSALGAAARDFLARRGGQWSFLVDRRTGKADLVQGSGVPLISGRGNALGAEALQGLELPGGEISVEALEPLLRSFIHEHAALLLPSRGQLELARRTSLSREGGRLISANFDWVVDGVPVEGAGVFVRLNSGNITQLGSAFIGNITLDTRPSVTAADALRRLFDATGDGELARVQALPELLIQPEDGGPTAIVFRLIWRCVYRLPDGLETWEARLDAHTGELIGFRDINRYARAVGGVYPRTMLEPSETVAPMPLVNVTADAVNLTADSAGFFPYGGGGASSGLNGLYFNTSCSGCSNPAQPGLQVAVGSGRLDFGVGGQDQVGNGRSTRADRNAFFHLNQVRRIAEKWLPSLSWLDTTNFTANVNINQLCNAVFTGSSVNFYRSGGGCNNTGEISDVIYHEWGHGLDSNTNAGGGGTGEGTADVTALHMTHSPLIGPGFRTDGSPVRNIDRATSPVGLVTVSNATSACGGGSHCAGQIYGQASWDLAQLLVARYGHHTGWRTSERIFFTSLPDADTYQPNNPGSIYSAYLMADDDDGNLANGTPNALQIFNALNTHEMAEAQAPSSPPCSRPTQPSLTVTEQCDRFDLSWPAVAGAQHYDVFRSELREDMAYFPLATLAASQTSFTDTTVAPGVDYWYVVMAVNTAGCESTVENPVAARLTPQPILDVTGAAHDDVPRGNRSGFPDPGEEVDLLLTLGNFGEIDAAALGGTILSTTPGVTLLDAGSAWPTLASGATAQNLDVLRFRTDEQLVACGALLRFEFVPDEASGCAAERSFFEIRMGQPDGQGGFVCDATPACFVPPSFGGLQSATSGASCGEINLSWQPAVSNCTNATLSYDVYRGTDPGFIPNAANRILSGWPSSSFIDSLLVPGQSFHYVVRALDSRSGAESNLIRRSAVPPPTPDIRPPVFAGIGTAGAGPSCGETVLGWSAALESCNAPVSYQIYRSTNPGFVPGAANLIGSSLSPSFVDAALAPGVAYTYVVRARDGVGNEGANEVRLTTGAGMTDLTLQATSFEPNNGAWSVISPNDATTGNWEWGDPQATEFQPEQDATPAGMNCWFTGLAAAGGAGGNDVDEGTTTLRSAAYDVSQAVQPAVRYTRWFTNDRGGSPGSDPFVVEVSNNDGASWVPLEQVGAGTPLAWVPVEISLSGIIAPSAQMRFRFTAADLGAGSLIEAGIDDFSIIDPDRGCTACPPNPGAVGTIFVGKNGNDVVLDWTADPVQATRFVVYKMVGPGFNGAVRVGTTDQRTFVHQGATLAAEDFFYRVSAVDACGQESPL